MPAPTVTGGLPIQIPQSATYSAAVLALAPINLATDIFFVGGSASKLITVTCLTVTGVATTGVNAAVQLFKRTAPNTGGNVTAVTPMLHDSANLPASASVGIYTSNPTALGAGILGRPGRLTLPTAAGVNSPGVLSWNFLNPLNAQGLVLRGMNERLCLNLNSVTISGASLSVWVSWLED